MEETGKSEQDLEEMLLAAAEDSSLGMDCEIDYATTFSAAGHMTSNCGLVIKLVDGSVFDLTIVKRSC